MAVMSWRTAVLADRHRALGSKLEDWGGMPTAWTYAGDIADQHEAIRTKAGLMDVSGLNKVHVVGPHAHHLLWNATTRDVTKITPGKSAYACMLDDRGKFTDDCVLFRTGPNSWMVVHGTGSGYQELTRMAAGKNVSVLFDDDIQDLSLQGPLAVNFLEKHVLGIRNLAYFHHMPASLWGADVLISRTGYTGERGYEIFCRGQDAGMIWDTILDKGKPQGIIPCCFTTLDWLRTECYLLFYPFDNSQMYPFANEAPGDTLWELGLDFTVSKGKTGFRGAEEHYRLKGKERFKIFGVIIDSDTAAEPGDEIFMSGKPAGVITCPMYSRLTKRSLAIARMSVEAAKMGVKLEVRGKTIKAAATSHPIAFDDPKKTKRNAIG